MLSRLAVPFVDARASALSWWLGDDAPAPLATLVLTGAAGTLELRLLGASHHVVARTGDARVPEVVACGTRATSRPVSTVRAWGLPGKTPTSASGALAAPRRRSLATRASGAGVYDVVALVKR